MCSRGGKLGTTLAALAVLALCAACLPPKPPLPPHPTSLGTPIDDSRWAGYVATTPSFLKSVPMNLL